MTVYLNRASRTALASAAIICFAAAFALTPRDAQSAADFATGVVPTAEPAAPPSPLPVIAPLRDPFSARVSDAAPTAPIPANVPSTGSPGILPSNLGASSLPLLPPLVPLPDASDRVSAVVSGPHSYALVTRGSETHLIGLGDQLDGSKVERITMEGVVLANGRTVTVAPSTPATFERTFGK